MAQPKVKFEISQTAELRTVIAFAKDAKYDHGQSLAWGIFRRHPELKKIIVDPTHLPLPQIKKYIRGVYAKNTFEFRKDTLVAEKQWRKKEKLFLKLVEREFGDSRWPQGKYIAYFTIWSMFPRFLEDKTFQVPFRHKRQGYINVIVSHEMLHFMFYKHFYEWYPEYKNPKHNYFVWNISEIFNVLIENSSRWVKIFKRKTMSYPQHDTIIRTLRKQIRGKTLSARELTVRIHEEVKRNHKSKK
jgi:predicted SprT family Zn-dependent metalloprotease